MSLKLGRNQPGWYLLVHFHDLLLLKPLLDDATKKTSALALLSFTYTARSSCWSLTTVKSPTAFAEETPSRYSSIAWFDPVARIAIKAVGRIHYSNLYQILEIVNLSSEALTSLAPNSHCRILMVTHHVISCDLIRYTMRYFTISRIAWLNSCYPMRPSVVVVVVVVVMPSVIMDVPDELTDKLTLKNTF